MSTVIGSDVVVTEADWREAAKQFGYPPDITREDIRYWDGGLKVADVDKRAQELARHRLSTQSAMQARIEELEAENDRLTKAVGSGILSQLLNGEEQDEFVKFIKFLRGSAEAQAVVSNIGGSNDG